MPASYNRVLLIGNLTRDPEVRYTGSGTAIARLGIAVNRRYRDRDDQWQEETTFVDVEVWGRQGENCNQYLSKGRSVFVEGRLKLDQWQDRNTGQNRSRLTVVGERVQFLGGPGDGDGGRGRSSSNRAPARSAPPPRQQQDDDEPFGIEDDEPPF
jgi:single-strand DNA-binding protein